MKEASEYMLKNAIPYLIVATIVIIMGIYWTIDFTSSIGYEMPVTAIGAEYAPSETCKTCHQDHYESWTETFHSKMNAPATPENMKAPINGVVNLEFYGQKVKFERVGDEYYVTLPYQGGDGRFLIEYTIGSRRMQQFTVRFNDRMFRIPVFYSIQDEKWMHINEAFFRRQDSGREAFLKGYSIWNANCIFCHNTRPNPGFNTGKQQFNSSVGELGISCEECHSEGSKHVESNRNPLKRFITQVTGSSDPTIESIPKMDKVRGLQVCGQCHGQRVPEPLRRMGSLLEDGDPFLAGQNLFSVYSPVNQHTKIPGFDQFYLRFWEDGSPRLTAFEMQGILASKCFTESENMTCITCHSGHSGDPKGMIKPEMRTKAACVQCHNDFSDPDFEGEHTQHAPGSTTCYSCHMPEVIYGVQSIHPSHLIRKPDPTRTVEHNMPNACNNCHLDRSVNWAIQQQNRFWNDTLKVSDNPDYDAAELVRGFAQGDAVYRTVLLDAAGRQNMFDYAQIYQEALNDEYYIVQHFGRRTIDLLYQTDGLETNLLDADGTLTELFNLLRSHRTKLDDDFEFGE